MASRRSAVLALGAVVAASVVVLVVAAASIGSERSQTLGLPPNGPIATIRAGQQLCESPIGTADEAHAVRFFPAGDGPRNPAIAVRVTDLTTGRVLGAGRLPAGTPSLTPQDVVLGHVPAQRFTSLCLRNLGPGHLSLLGGVQDDRQCRRSHTDYAGQRIGCNVVSFKVLPLTPGVATVDGRPLVGDLAAELLLGHRRSLLDQAGLMMRRASLFRPSWVGVWTWWALLVACVVGVPACLMLALARARRREG